MEVHRNIENNKSRCQSPVYVRDSKESIITTKSRADMKPMEIEKLAILLKDSAFLKEKPKTMAPMIADINVIAETRSCIVDSKVPSVGHPESHE